MPLFESKPKLSIEECCRQFYDSHIFHSSLVDTDSWALFLQHTKELIAEVDPSFSSVDPNIFQREMTAICMELFALACLRKLKKFEYCYPQSIFTRTYLEENKIPEIWEIMGEYNQAIAMSVTMNAKGKQLYSGAIGRGIITFINSMSFNLLEEFIKNYLGDRVLTQEGKDILCGCASMVINRRGADIKRENGVLIVLLTSRLATRLGCDENLKTEALLWLGAKILGFYEGAEEYLKSVHLQV